MAGFSHKGQFFLSGLQIVGFLLLVDGGKGAVFFYIFVCCGFVNN